jgi:hypothetical protein
MRSSNLSRRGVFGAIVAIACASYLYQGHRRAFDLRAHIYALSANLPIVSIPQEQLNAMETYEERLMSRDWRGVEDETTFLERVLDIVRNDFFTGRVVEMDGWLISEFERDLVHHSNLISRQTSEVRGPEMSGFAHARPTNFIEIRNWGPKAACAGEAFNKQSDGHSSHWFETGPYIGALRVYVGGVMVPTTKGAGIVTTKIAGGVFDTIAKTSARHEIIMYDPSRELKQHIGHFEVLKRSSPAITEAGRASTVFGLVEGWGPTQVTVGNLYRSRTSNAVVAIWVQSACAPPDALIQVGTIALSTTVGSTTITGVFPDLGARVTPALYPVRLQSRQRSETVHVGDILVQP